MNSSTDVFWFFVVIVLSLGGLVFLMLHNECLPDQLGEIQVSRNRGNRIERCNGEKWVPYKLEAK